jgi:PAS domain S-box-containing protein
MAKADTPRNSRKERDNLFYLCTPCELEDIIESSHDGLFITDGLGNVVMVNNAWERICGISREFVLGKNAADLVNQKFYTESSVMGAIAGKRKVTIMLEMTKGEKIGQKIMATAIPIFDDSGEIRRVVANIRDITEILYLKELLGKTQELNAMYAAELEQMRRIHILENRDIVARSPATKRVMEMAAQVAKVDSTVLLTGESGCGKEVIAKVIHRLSHRASGPLIKVNCGAIPETLLESELFGYDAGAFTGARKHGKPGMFELAKHGTLFLDEIGDISFKLQAKLLRALQDQQIMRVGGIKPTQVDARIITATNRNLQAMVKEGQFRDDLYYRLNVVSIEIPPLRERKEDIPLLVLQFIERINKKYSFEKRISPEVIDGFLMYPWPGNVRELENVTERMLVMTGENEIRINHVPLTVRNYIVPTEDDRPDLSSHVPLKKALERTESHLIEQTLRKYGTTRKVAQALKINQSTVVRKIRKYKLSSLCRDLDTASPFDDLEFRI